jgi:hypothetical protein
MILEKKTFCFVKISLFCTAFFALFSCKPVQKSAILLHKSSQTLPKIDGKLDEWQTEFRTSSNLPDIRFQILPMEKHLYICTRTSSQNAQTMIIRLGMGVWVDTTGKQRGLMGIQFPLALTAEQEAALATRSAGGKLEAAYMELCNEFELVGFSPEPLRATNISSQNFKAAVGFDELGEMICEYQIPWRGIFQSRDLRWDEALTVGIKINPLPKSEQDDDPNNSVLGTGITQGSNNPMNQNTGMNTGNNPMNPNRTIPRPTGQPTTPSMWLRVQLSAADAPKSEK